MACCVVCVHDSDCDMDAFASASRPGDAGSAASCDLAPLVHSCADSRQCISVGPDCAMIGRDQGNGGLGAFAYLAKAQLARLMFQSLTRFVGKAMQESSAIESKVRLVMATRAVDQLQVTGDQSGGVVRDDLFIGGAAKHASGSMIVCANADYHVLLVGKSVSRARMITCLVWIFCKRHRRRRLRLLRVVKFLPVKLARAFSSLSLFIFSRSPVRRCFSLRC